jgi:hypothetical protein
MREIFGAGHSILLRCSNAAPRRAAFRPKTDGDLLPRSLAEVS